MGWRAGISRDDCSGFNASTISWPWATTQSTGRAGNYPCGQPTGLYSRALVSHPCLVSLWSRAHALGRLQISGADFLPMRTTGQPGSTQGRKGSLTRKLSLSIVPLGPLTLSVQAIIPLLTLGPPPTSAGVPTPLGVLWWGRGRLRPPPCPHLAQGWSPQPVCTHHHSQGQVSLVKNQGL